MYNLAYRVSESIKEDDKCEDLGSKFYSENMFKKSS